MVQTGVTSSFSAEDTTSYLAIKTRAIDLRALLKENGLSPQKSPTLNKLIDDAIELSDAWFCNQLDRVTFVHMVNALQIDRIAAATLPLRGSSSAEEKLAALLSGSINLLDGKQSKAKNILWELELLHTLSLNGISAEIGEPDVVVSFDGPHIGIACKKLYSESNVSKVLSQAVHQIERAFDFGVVALNIDDRLPENAILKAPSIDRMSDILANRNSEFIRTHERHLRRYLQPGRAISAFVSCAAIADVEPAKPRFLNARQSTVWHIPGLPLEKERQMEIFFETFNSMYPA